MLCYCYYNNNITHNNLYLFKFHKRLRWIHKFQYKMENDELQDIQVTWKKLESTAKKTGIREGISDGRDKNFQKSFDIGFEEGFKNGFLLGKFKGTLIADAKQNSSEFKTHPLLEKISRGTCEICNSGMPIVEETVQNLVQLQNDCYKNNEETLTLHLEKNISKT